MTKIISPNPKRSAPTSDGDFESVMERVVDSIGLLQDASTRGLPSRFSLQMSYSEEGEPVGLVIVDNRLDRRATINLTWE